MPVERADEYLVRQAVTVVRVGINEDYALDDQHVLRWRLTRTDGGNVKADAADISGLALRDGKQWQADLSGVDWRRGEYQMRVGLQARTDGPEVASESVTLRFQPPAPVVALRPNGKAVETTGKPAARYSRIFNGLAASVSSLTTNGTMAASKALA